MVSTGCTSQDCILLLFCSGDYESNSFNRSRIKENGSQGVAGWMAKGFVWRRHGNLIRMVGLVACIEGPGGGLA